MMDTGGPLVMDYADIKERSELQLIRSDASAREGRTDGWEFRHIGGARLSIWLLLAYFAYGT